jgi:prevent-host-death family protein
LVTVKEKGSAQTNMAQLVSEMASHDGMSLGHELSTRGQAFLVLLDWPHEEGNIAEAKNNLSALIDGLKGGGSRVLIVERGRPVARLEPATGYFEGGQDGRLERLLREGLVRPRWARPPRALFSSQPPHANAGASAVDVLIEERQEGR